RLVAGDRTYDRGVATRATVMVVRLQNLATHLGALRACSRESIMLRLFPECGCIRLMARARNRRRLIRVSLRSVRVDVRMLLDRGTDLFIGSTLEQRTFVSEILRRLGRGGPSRLDGE